MSTKLKAGTVSTGAVIDADTTGILEFQTGSTPTTAITVDTSQNVGIGTTSPNKLGLNKAITTNSSSGYVGYELSVGNTITADFITNASNAFLTTRTAIPLVFQTNDTERMRVDSSGNVLVGTTTSYGLMTVARSTANSYNYASNSIANQPEHMAFLNSGTVVGSIVRFGGTGVQYNTSSDYRLKENIAPMTGALDKVTQLKPCTYTWKLDGTKGQGFIAHELQAVIPDAVSGEKDAVDEDGKVKPQGVDYSKIVATLTAAIQELNAKVTALETQLGAK